MRLRAGRFAAAAAVLVAVAVPPFAAAATPPSIVVENGVTQPVFGYTDAIRERVWVDAAFDSDNDGFTDRIALDIIRPAASAAGLDVPVVMDASPYYTTLGRGNESERIADLDSDGLNDRWPLFYDNYFVPRGYAVVLLHMVGTGFSSGCPVTGGTPDNLSAKAGIDWLNGRTAGFDEDGNAVVADWHNGRTGMIGKSYDGTLANATAATGVDGLSTIVPISAISNWYDYTRSNGIRFNTNYPSSLSNTVTNPDRRAYCAPVRAVLNDTDGDETGDYTPFWAERDYNPRVSNVKASVFVVHGINDNNVKPDHFSKWWYGLAANHVPRKIWLTQTGHVDPFDFRRTEWVATLHRWFDHWLHGVQNGIMNEPMADFERSADVWETSTSWPDPEARKTALHLKAVAGAAGEFSLTEPNRKTPDGTFVDNPTQSTTTIIGNPTTVTPNRLVFLSRPLQAPLKISGRPHVLLRGSADQADTNLGAVLVDYGTATRVAWGQSGEGIQTVTTEDCWGENGADPAVENACYRQTAKRVTTAATELVTKGILDGLNRNSVEVGEALVPGQTYDFDFDLLPEDYVFEAGKGPVSPAPPCSIGVPRFELGTSPTRTERATRLRHTPSPHRVARPHAIGTHSARPRHTSGTSRRYRFLLRQQLRGGEVNVVTLIGNLASDIDVLDLDEDRKRVTFRLAVDRYSSDGGTDFFDVAVWGKQAAPCERFLAKGKRIGLYGRLRSRSWEAADGTKRYGVEVVANHVEFLWPPSGGHQSPDESGEPFGEVVALAERSMA